LQRNRVLTSGRSDMFMANINIINQAWLEGTIRIDSEYYQTEFIEANKRITSKTYVTLERLAHISDGNHLKIADDFLDGDGVRYLRGQDISYNMVIDDRNKVFIPESAYEQLKRSHIFKDDILVTIVGANTGFTGLVYDAPDKLTANCKLGIVRINSNVSPAYVYSFLSSKYGQMQIKQSKRGGGQTGLVLPDLRNIKIPRFSSDFEDYISKRVYQGHELLKHSKELYESAERVLLEHLNLLNWTPNHTLTYETKFSNLVDGSRIDAERYQPKYVEMINRIPDYVKLQKLGILVTMKKGTEIGGKNYRDTGIPFWRVSNISKYGLDESTIIYMSQQLYHELKDEFEPRENEMLLTKDATPGVALYLDYPIKGIVSSGILRLSIKGDIPPLFLELVLNSIFVQLQIERDAGGSIIKHWKPSHIFNTLIPRLDRKIELKIANMVTQSHNNRRLAFSILKETRQAIEMAIEKDEREALRYFKS
jgi:type I restriction enzyme S subunit